MKYTIEDLKNDTTVKLVAHRLSGEGRIGVVSYLRDVYFQPKNLEGLLREERITKVMSMTNQEITDLVIDTVGSDYISYTSSGKGVKILPDQIRECIQWYRPFTFVQKGTIPYNLVKHHVEASAKMYIPEEACVIALVLLGEHKKSGFKANISLVDYKSKYFPLSYTKQYSPVDQ